MDGTIRFFLMYSPRWLFLWPGALLIASGVLACAVALPGLSLFGVTFDVHTLLVGCLAILMGCQSVLFAIFARTFAVTEGLMPEDARLNRFFEIFYLERGLLLGSGAFAVGMLLILRAVQLWAAVGWARSTTRPRWLGDPG
jgi:hypothetical protein